MALMIRPAPVATIKTVAMNATKNFFLNNLDNITTSGILAPAPPITNAITVPIDIPFDIRASAICNIVSGRIYLGIQITAAIITENNLSPLAYSVIKSEVINLILTVHYKHPINLYGTFG